MQAELERLWRRLQPLATPAMPLDAPPPHSTRFGSPLVLSRVHWVRPQLVAEVKFLTWTEDNLLRQAVYEGLREDKPAAEVRRDVPHAKAVAARKNSEPAVRPGMRFSRSASSEKKRHVGDMTLLCESRVVGNHIPQGRWLSHNKCT